MFFSHFRLPCLQEVKDVQKRHFERNDSLLVVGSPELARLSMNGVLPVNCGNDDSESFDKFWGHDGMDAGRIVVSRGVTEAVVKEISSHKKI